MLHEVCDRNQAAGMQAKKITQLPYGNCVTINFTASKNLILCRSL